MVGIDFGIRVSYVIGSFSFSVMGAFSNIANAMSQ